MLLARGGLVECPPMQHVAKSRFKINNDVPQHGPEDEEVHPVVLPTNDFCTYRLLVNGQSDLRLLTEMR